MSLKMIPLTALIAVLTQVVPAQQSTLENFFSDFSADWVRHDPSLATATRYFTGDEQNRLERQITPQTSAWKLDRIQRAKRGLAELNKFDRSSLNENQRVSADLMQWQLQTIVDEEPYLDFSFPLEQFQGANVGLVNLLIFTHPLVTAGDAENYVAALGQVSPRLQEAMTESQRLAMKGVLPPKFILQATIDQMNRFTESAAAQNPLITVLGQKMDVMKELPAARRQALRSQAEGIVGRQVYPVYKKAIALLQSQIPRATDDAGLWRLKGGSEAYTYFLHRYTTTSMTPEEIHQLGLRQIQTIKAQMEEVFESLSRVQGSLEERIAKLQADLAYENPASDESREKVMKDIDVILRDAQQRSALLFDKRPKAPVVAQPYPTFQESKMRRDRLTLSRRIPSRHLFVSQKRRLDDEVRASQYHLSRSGARTLLPDGSADREYKPASVPAGSDISVHLGIR